MVESEKGGSGDTESMNEESDRRLKSGLSVYVVRKEVRS